MQVRFLSPLKLVGSEEFLAIATKEKEASHAMAFSGASSGKELRCLPLIKILDDSKDDFSATGDLAGSYQSAHLSFQEYFAATRIANFFMDFDEEWTAAINRNKQDQMFFGRLSETDANGEPHQDGDYFAARGPFAARWDLILEGNKEQWHASHTVKHDKLLTERKGMVEKLRAKSFWYEGADVKEKPCRWLGSDIASYFRDVFSRDKGGGRFRAKRGINVICTNN